MKTKQSIANIFPKHLFWDLNIDTLDLQKDKDIIIPRALYATTADTFLQDITKLEQFYTKPQIIMELRTTKERISNNVCTLVSKRYHLPSFSRFRK